MRNIFITVKSVKNSSQFTQIDSTGNLPEYKVPTGGGQRKSWGGSKGLTPDEKLVFLKKQLVAEIQADGFNTDLTTIKLVQQLHMENQINADVLDTFFDLLTACTR